MVTTFATTISSFLRNVYDFSGIQYSYHIQRKWCEISNESGLVVRINMFPPYSMYRGRGTVLIGNLLENEKILYDRKGLVLKPIRKLTHCENSQFSELHDDILLKILLNLELTEYTYSTIRGEIASVFLTCKRLSSIVNRFWEVVLPNSKEYMKSLYCGFRLKLTRRQFLPYRIRTVSNCQYEEYLAVTVTNRLVKFTTTQSPFQITSNPISEDVATKIIRHTNHAIILYLSGACELFSIHQSEKEYELNVLKLAIIRTGVTDIALHNLHGVLCVKDNKIWHFDLHTKNLAFFTEIKNVNIKFLYCDDMRTFVASENKLYLILNSGVKGVIEVKDSKILGLDKYLHTAFGKFLIELYCNSDSYEIVLRPVKESTGFIFI